MYNITPEKAIAFTKLSVMLIAVWPQNDSNNKFKNHFESIIWFFNVVCTAFLLLPLIISIYTHNDDPSIVSKSVCLSCAVSQAIVKSIVCRIHKKKLKTFSKVDSYYLLQFDKKFTEYFSTLLKVILIGKLTNVNNKVCSRQSTRLTYLKTAKDHERALMENCIRRNANLHLLLTFCCYGATFVVICGPLFLPTPLPTEAEYPFPVDTSPMWEIAYIHNTIAGFQASAGMCVDCLVALLIWFTGLRFELLYKKFKNIQNKNDLIHCIVEHQFLLRYGEELSDTFRYVTFATVGSVSAGLAFAGIYLFSPQPIFVKGQFIIVCLSAGINLYITALPSDYLIEMCQKMADVAYDTLWMKGYTGITGNWIIIIKRSQKPIVISIPGLIKELSLQFYFSMLSSTFSYFTALHVMLTEEN